MDTRSKNAAAHAAFGRVTKRAARLAARAKPALPAPGKENRRLPPHDDSVETIVLDDFAPQPFTCLGTSACSADVVPESQPQCEPQCQPECQPQCEPECDPECGPGPDASAAAVLSVCYAAEPAAGVRGDEAGALAADLTGVAPGAVYVCGSPGAGKSVTVAKTLRELVGAGELGSAVWAHCAGLTPAARVFDEVAAQLGLDTAHGAAAAIAEFAVQGGERHVVVLEEIDFLPTKLLYTVFEWPSLPGSRLSVVGVSNAIDLPVKSLPWLKATGRLPRVLPFRPYTAAELTAIVRARLELAGASAKTMLSDTAIMLAARKVAAVSGDARLVLDVCREAVLQCEASASLALSPVFAVSQALARRGGSSLGVDTIRGLPTQQKLVLCAVAIAEKRVAEGTKAQAAAAAKRMTLAALYEAFKGMCRTTNMPCVGFTDFVDVCCDSLCGNHGLLDVTEKRKRGRKAFAVVGGEPRNRIARLKGISVADVQEAVNDTRILSLIVGTES